MYLLDTNVVSALRRPDRHPGPTLWLEAQRAPDVYLSVVTLGVGAGHRAADPPSSLSED